MIPLFLYRLRVRIALRLRKVHGSANREQAVIDAYDALVAAEAKRREV